MEQYFLQRKLSECWRLSAIIFLHSIFLNQYLLKDEHHHLKCLFSFPCTAISADAAMESWRGMQSELAQKGLVLHLIPGLCIKQRHSCEREDHWRQLSRL